MVIEGTYRHGAKEKLQADCFPATIITVQQDRARERPFTCAGFRSRRTIIVNELQPNQRTVQEVMVVCSKPDMDCRHWVLQIVFPGWRLAKSMPFVQHHSRPERAREAPCTSRDFFLCVIEITGIFHTEASYHWLQLFGPPVELQNHHHDFLQWPL